MGRRGRPRIVRTPSEEREYQLRRKEARRARIRNLTEEQRAIVRSKEAAAKRRRREANAALRQRENEAQRRRRQNPKVCQREAGMMGRRGRPRIVRTPSQEREYQLRRKEARRARMRNLTEEQRAILKQRAIEAERRRRQNPKVLQRDAAKHRARREDEAADCSLQTDGTGKVIAVQTEEWPWPEIARSLALHTCLLLLIMTSKADLCAPLPQSVVFTGIEQQHYPKLSVCTDGTGIDDRYSIYKCVSIRNQWDDTIQFTSITSYHCCCLTMVPGTKERLNIVAFRDIVY
ncbi:hypothetical protein HPB50_012012 [Hyalomma asiaticum]|uniref:Uncharacterized protein n=1 Tax=Hyalomma asiaticum TaxID=266040 RepID=A0ACB7RRN9_HYAAI|nr:hypothetical protein HPB50_012012 [Hyalomma asiaticum]